MFVSLCTVLVVPLTCTPLPPVPKIYSLNHELLQSVARGVSSELPSEVVTLIDSGESSPASADNYSLNHDLLQSVARGVSSELRREVVAPVDRGYQQSCASPETNITYDDHNDGSFIIREGICYSTSKVICFSQKFTFIG